MQSFRFVLLCSIFLFSAFAKAQTFTISGTLKDKVSLEPLEAATVFLETIKDSTLVTYTITNAKGNFKLEGRNPKKKASVNISFIGYQNYRKEIDFAQTEIDLGEIFIEEQAATLGEVVLKSRAPVTIKKDTLEFNVKSFKTKKDATIEDLLKELPGVEVDEEGQITVNGKPVNKLLVNGKPFFGDDPTIATRNLTKEIVEKIQVTDTKTDSQAFAGEDGDDENKTINLTIAEENNKGVFGRLAAGTGTNQRFEYAGIVSMFNNDRRVSVLAGGNNINSPGFSFGEINKMFGGGGSSFISSTGSFGIGGRNFGGGSGIINSRNIGANYADVLSEKVDIDAEYFYSGANNFNKTKTERENILPDRRFFTNNVSESNGNSDNHEASFDVGIKVDSTFFINYNADMELARNISRSASSERSFDADAIGINRSEVNTKAENTGKNFNQSLSLTKRFGDAGSFLKMRLNHDVNTSESEEFLNSEIEIFGDDSEVINRDQFTDGSSTRNTINGNVTFRLPIFAKKFFLDTDIAYYSDSRNSKRSTFDLDPVSSEYTVFSELLSTDFDSRNVRTTPKLTLSYNGEKLRTRFGAGYVFRTISNEDALRPELNIEQNFEAIELSSYFNYKLSSKMSVYTGYNLRNSPPSLRQLNSFVDVSNPLNTVQGNPDLSPSNSHSVYGGLRNYDFQNGGGYYINARANVRNDAVVSKTTIDENLVRTTTYENVDGNYNFGFGGGYDKTTKLDSLRTLKYGLGLNSNFNRSINFNNDIKYASNRQSITPNLRLTFTWKDFFVFQPRYGVSFTKTKFGIDAFEDQEFLNHNLRLSTSVFVPKNFEWRNDAVYNYNPNVAAGFQKSSWFWNSTVAYSFMKEKATVSVKVYDVLNQNTNARRTTSANFIQDVESTVLQQYVMFSFSWKFNTLGKAGESSNSNTYFF